MKKTLLTLPVLLGLLAAGHPGLAQHKPSTTHTAVPHATRTVSGRVRDAFGKSLPGVTVLLKGTQTGVATDTAGHYQLAGVPAKGAVLVFSFVGYAAQERSVPAKGGPLNVVLRADQMDLQEVVVTGAAPVQRQSVSGSIATVNAAPTMLQGRVAGVAISRESRKARRESSRIRDASSAPAQQNTFFPSAPNVGYLNYPARSEAGAGDTYAKIQENAFHPVGKEPLSTFSLDVDNASYTNVRRFLNEGQLPPRDAVRVEELLNYFHYQLPAPAATSPDPVRISAELSECPWAPGHQLARIGVQAKQVETAALPPANLVFLVDVSGKTGFR
jgi:Ca-activated chloride channel family protein